MQLLQQQVWQIPGMKETLDQINAAGGDPQKAFMQQALAKSIDSSGAMEMVNQIKSIVM